VNSHQLVQLTPSSNLSHQIISYAPCNTSGPVYLGSRPPLVRKDSKTYEISHNGSNEKRLAIVKLTERTNFRADIFTTIALGMLKSDVGVPLGTCNHTPHASPGRSGTVPHVSAHLARHRTSTRPLTFLSPLLSRDAGLIHAT
jgi:hypothetical protein